jgi:outer membrane protein assembly factor BamB
MPSRRRVLEATGVGFALLAGCIGTESTPEGTDPPTAPAPTPGSPGGTNEPRPTATARDSDPLDVSGAWSQYGFGPTRSGFAPDATGVPADASTYWHLRRIRSGPPVLADGMLYHHAKLGEDTSGRSTLTRTRTEESTAHPVFGVPYLLARDASDGSIEWQRRLPERFVGWPAVAGDTLVNPTRNTLMGLDAGDGRLRWSHDVEGLHTPAVTGDTVVLPRNGLRDGQSGEKVREGQVRAYAHADGTHRWTVPMPKRANSLAVADGTVVVVSGGWDGTGVVLGLSLADGSERWRKEISGDSFEGPVISGGTAYVSSNDDRLHALSVADGSGQWARRIDRSGGLAAGGGSVYLAGRTMVALHEDDGSTRWRVDGEGYGWFVTPAVGDGVVYTGTRREENGVLALDAGDGSERWSQRMPLTVVEGDVYTAGLERQPTVADGAVYAPAVDGLYAFGPA